MQRTLLAFFINVILPVALAGYSVCQSEPAEKPLKDSQCVVDISHFARTTQTSPEVIRLQSALIDPDISVTQRLILELANRSVGDMGFSRPQLTESSTVTPAQKREAIFYRQYFDGSECTFYEPILLLIQYSMNSNPWPRNMLSHFVRMTINSTATHAAHLLHLLESALNMLICSR